MRGLWGGDGVVSITVVLQEVAFNDKSKTEIQDALSNCTYLQDDALTVEGHPCEPQLLLMYQLLTQFARCMLYSQV